MGRTVLSPGLQVIQDTIWKFLVFYGNMEQESEKNVKSKLFGRKRRQLNFVDRRVWWLEMAATINEEPST